MKTDIHPTYRLVVFQDQSAGTAFLTRSTIAAAETIEWSDGNEYPLARVEISSASHPFFTGTMKIVDTAGRVERFERRYGQRRSKQEDVSKGKGRRSSGARGAARRSADKPLPSSG